MGPFQIAFIAVNLILPTWLYFRSDPSKVEWKAWEKNMTRLIDAGGGANCPSHDIVNKLRELCEKSLRKQSKSEVIIFEQDIGDHTYSCEARSISLAIKISRAEAVDPDHRCVLEDKRGTIARQPSFVFTQKGFVNSMSFDAENGERQTIAVSSCRRKLKVAQTLVPANAEALESALPPSPNDPADQKTANRFCWLYDAAPGWAEIRRRYLEKSE